MKGKGALPDHEIIELIESDCIPGAVPENVESGSIDLSISSEIYRTDGTFLPEFGQSVRSALSKVNALNHPISAVMEVGVVYVAKLREDSDLPETVYGYANPKSSTGRNRVHVRLLVDGVPRYDSLPLGNNHGQMWLSIAPQAMPVIVQEGERLNQIRIFTDNTRFEEFELESAMKKYRLLYDKFGKEIYYKDLSISDRDGSVLLTLDLSLSQIGWQCPGSSKVLDLSKRDFYEPDGIFEPLHSLNGSVKLKKDTFYILQSREYVRVPPQLACEMVPMDERSGDFRSHEAGFIDPGWGWGTEGEVLGRPLTLEVIPFEDLIFHHGQAIAKIRFERLRSEPNSIYGAKKSGIANYCDQVTPLLSKHFRKSLQIKA